MSWHVKMKIKSFTNLILLFIHNNFTIGQLLSFHLLTLILIMTWFVLLFWKVNSLFRFGSCAPQVLVQCSCRMSGRWSDRWTGLDWTECHSSMSLINTCVSVLSTIRFNLTILTEICFPRVYWSSVSFCKVRPQTRVQTRAHSNTNRTDKCIANLLLIKVIGDENFNLDMLNDVASIKLNETMKTLDYNGIHNNLVTIYVWLILIPIAPTNALLPNLHLLTVLTVRINFIIPNLQW